MLKIKICIVNKGKMCSVRIHKHSAMSSYLSSIVCHSSGLEVSNLGIIKGFWCQCMFMWFSVNSPGETTVCEGQVLSLQCPTDQVITIMYANYGRTDNNYIGCPLNGTRANDGCRSQVSQGLVRWW